MFASHRSFVPYKKAMVLQNQFVNVKHTMRKRNLLRDSVKTEMAKLIQDCFFLCLLLLYNTCF
jgi:hypothetical protein